MGRVVALGALTVTLLVTSSSFGQTEFAAGGRATTHAKQALPAPSREDADFDAGVARQMKLLEFTRRLAVEQVEREAQEFDQRVQRYLKLADFMRRLDEQREAGGNGPVRRP